MVAVALVFVVGGCSSSGDDPTLAGDVPTTASTTSTSRPETTTSAPACPSVFPAADEVGLVERAADVDGDGRSDRVQSFPLTGEGAARVALLVDLAAGGGGRVDLEAQPGLAPALLGATALDQQDPQHLLWVRVGAGASTVIVGLYRLDGCELAPVRRPNGDPVELPVGGTVRTLAGAECGSGLDPEADLVVYEGRSADGDAFDVTATEHRYADGVLSPSPDVDPVTERTDDPARYGRFRCGDVEL